MNVKRDGEFLGRPTMIHRMARITLKIRVPKLAKFSIPGIHLFDVMAS